MFGLELYVIKLSEYFSNPPETTMLGIGWYVALIIVLWGKLIFTSFISLRFWFLSGYLFYIVVLGLLFWASFFGITAQGSQRWINLYFLNLQPSELMKIAIIICFAKFFHRVQIDNVNSLKNTLIPLIVLIIQWTNSSLACWN